MVNESSSPTVTNRILWGDTPNEVKDVNSTSTVTYSGIQGGWSGEGNIDKNPLLRSVSEGYLSLAPWPPCIDTANNDVVPPDVIDITAMPRPVDGDCNATVTAGSCATGACAFEDL